VYLPPQNKALGGTIVPDYYVNRIADAEDEPLTLADAVVHRRIDLGSPADTIEQDYVESLFPAARKSIENIIHRPIGSQVFELGMTNFPCGWIIELPMSPLIAIQTIKYTKQDGTVVTYYDSTASPVVDPATFTVETGSDPGAIFLKSTEAWPTDILANGFPVKIRFTAGYVEVPDPLLQAIRFMFAHFYSNREPVTDGRVTQPFVVPMTVAESCSEYVREYCT
jgi:uncharacterized phiE125 gp8 family phage protein